MDKQSKKSKLLPPVQAARALGVSYNVLNSWRRKGCPVHNTQAGLRVVAWYNLDEVRAWRDRWCAEPVCGKGVKA